MAEDTNKAQQENVSTNEEVKQETPVVEAAKAGAPVQQQNERGSRGRDGRGRGRGKMRTRAKRAESEFDTKIISIRRVAHSYKGGKRLHISVCAAVGDRSGRVGIGVGKGSDVRDAQTKAIADAKKNIVMVLVKDNTVPHEIIHKYGASKIFIKPAAPGTGLIAGSSARTVFELAGYKDVLSKLLGSRNSINNAYAAVEALKSMRPTRL